MTKRPEVAPPPNWRFPTCNCTTLDNGLAVKVFHLPGQYVVSATLAFELPLTLEGDHEGVATITARCLDEGTPRFPGSAFAEAIEDQGAQVGVDVGTSGTDVTLDVPGSRLNPALDLLAEMVSSPTLTADDVERQVAVRLAEIEQVMANSAQRASLEFRAAAIHTDSRLARPVGGRPEAVARITEKQVSAFHAANYGPANATLVMAGDFATDPIRAAEQAFGTWHQPTTRPSHAEVPSGPPTCLVIDRPGAVQADLRLGNLTITRNHPDWAAMQVASYALGGAFLSRLNQELRERRGFTYGVSMGIAPMRRAGIGAVQGAFRPETVAAALDVIRASFDLDRQPFATDEVTPAINYFTGVTPLRFAAAAGVADQVATLITNGLGVEFIDQNLAALRRVTPESATASARTHLDPGRMSLVVVGPAEVFADQLLAEGWPVTVIG